MLYSHIQHKQTFGKAELGFEMTIPATEKTTFCVCVISLKDAFAIIPDDKYPLISDVTSHRMVDKDVLVKETENCVKKKKKKGE